MSWVNRNRTGVNRGSNTKPQLRLDLVPVLDYYTPTRLRQAEKRVKIFHPSATPQLPLETASVLLQQEVLEFVLEHLAAFHAPKMRDYLNDGDPDSDLYAARFREDTWAGVLKIVRWHVSECRPKWLPVEGSDKPPEAEPSTQAANLTDAFCNYAAGLTAVREDEGLYSKLRRRRFEPLSLRGCRSSAVRSRTARRCNRTMEHRAAKVRMPTTMGRRSLWRQPPLRRPLRWTVPSSTRSQPRNQPRSQMRHETRRETRRETPHFLFLTGLDAWPTGGRTGMADGKRSPTRHRGTARRRRPLEKKQRDRLVSREGQQRRPKTVTPQHQAASNGWVEPPPVRSSLFSKPGPPRKSLDKAPEGPIG